jgi:hypothetical protein
MVEPLLIVWRVIREQLGILHRRLLAIVRDDDVCRLQTNSPHPSSREGHRVLGNNHGFGLAAMDRCLCAEVHAANASQRSQTTHKCQCISNALF